MRIAEKSAEKIGAKLGKVLREPCEIKEKCEESLDKNYRRYIFKKGMTTFWESETKRMT
jgi:hypothetical protein